MSFPVNSYKVNAIPILKFSGVVDEPEQPFAGYFCKRAREEYRFRVKERFSAYSVPARVSTFVRPPRTTITKPAVLKQC